MADLRLPDLAPAPGAIYELIMEVNGMVILDHGFAPEVVWTSVFRLGLLGGFRLTQLMGEPGRDGSSADQGFGTEIELPAGVQRVIAVVALRGRLSRSRIAGTLWPETTEHRALASLRTAIWRANRVAPVLNAPLSSVGLNPQVRVDVHDLVGLSRSVKGESEGPDSGRIELSRLLELIDSEAELLPDWDDEWLLHDRERLRQLRLHMMESVAERLMSEGNFALAIEAAMAAVRADALRESAHRLVIRVHVAEGNLAEARRAYEVCRLVLDRELGVEPSPQTRQFIAATTGAMATGVVATAPAPSAVAPTPTSSHLLRRNERDSPVAAAYGRRR